jgi:16S rRNA (guanine527-N7)-methyltransferase
VFPSGRLPLIEAYAASLAGEAVVRGLIGPREAPRLWERHLLNCAVLGEAIPTSVTVCDVGSGAGLPGVVLAIARPDLTVTLVEPLLRRTRYLTEVVEDLGLENIEVVRARAEELHGRRTFEVVTSRAVAPLVRLLPWSMPLVAPHGHLVAMKGSNLAEEIAEAADVVGRLGTTTPEILTLGTGGKTPQTFAVRVAWADPSRVTCVEARPGTGRRTRGNKPRRRKG